MPPPRIRIIPHAPDIPDVGSYEVRYPGGRESTYYFWDNNPGRRSFRNVLSQEQALKAAQERAREEQERLDRLGSI